MKALIFILTLFFSSLVFAQSNCEYSCSVQCRALAERILNNCNGGGYPNPNPPPPSGDRIELYNSDTCSSDLIAIINPMSDCSRLQGMPKAWGIKVRGTCMDIADTTSEGACYLMKAVVNPYAVGLYNSDTCSGDLIAYVDGSTNCEMLGQFTQKRVWGIRLNGQCRDISDMPFVQACEQFKYGR